MRGTLPLYRAAILPRFVRLLKLVHSKAGSVTDVAEALIQNPQLYTFRSGRPNDIGIMPFGTLNPLRTKFPVFQKPAPSKSPCGPLKRPEISGTIWQGCLWMLAAARDPSDVEWLLPLCKTALEKEHVAEFNRRVATIAAIGTPDAIRGLARLRSKTRHASMLNQLDAVLAQAASASGLTTVEAEELVAPDHGLDATHRCKLPLAEGISAVLSLTGSGQGTIHHETTDGTPVPKLPATIRAAPGCEATLKRLRSDAKLLSADLAIHRQRLERAWITGQTWSWATFKERWLAHPGGTLDTCMFQQDESRYDPDGNPLADLADGALLSLWHPLHAGADRSFITARWRTTLEKLRIEQPIRQAWRETYLITQAEQESSPASHRYSKHILNQSQTVEIGRKRGWRIRTLSPHEPSSESAPWTFNVPFHGVYAEFRTGGVGIESLPHGAGAFPHILTDRIRFCILQDKGDWRYDGGRKLTQMKTPVRLGDIDPIVFSEIMRDVDLMVSTAVVTGISFDPETLLSIPDLGTWRRQAGLAEIAPPTEPHFGGLAQTRREALEQALPLLNAGTAVNIQGHHVLVTGKRHQYQIHLGTADVMILPHARHLLLPPEAGKTDRKETPTYHPLHDDERLNLILHRILLLLKDDRIRDRSILDQFEALAS